MAQREVGQGAGQAGCSPQRSPLLKREPDLHRRETGSGPWKTLAFLKSGKCKLKLVGDERHLGGSPC